MCLCVRAARVHARNEHEGLSDEGAGRADVARGGDTCEEERLREEGDAAHPRIERREEGDASAR
jgi:hypothetical protein